MTKLNTNFYDDDPSFMILNLFISLGKLYRFS